MIYLICVYTTKICVKYKRNTDVTQNRKFMNQEYNENIKILDLLIIKNNI